MAAPRLRPKQRKALDALLATASIAAAAKQVGVSRSTFSAWTHEPEFANALREIEDDAIRGMGIRLSACTDAAITKTIQIMADPSTPPSVSLRAADIILGRALELRELTVIEERLRAIEAALETRGTR